VRRALKIIGWTVAGIFLLIGMLGVAAYFFLTSDFLRAQIENRANAESGRKTTIGRIAVDWGWTARVHLDNVQVSNADWAKPPYMFSAQEIAFDIELWPLLRGDIVMPHLLLRKPELDLERNQQDQSNWSAEQSPAASVAIQQVKPQQRHQTPLIGRLEIVDGHVKYSDVKRKLELDGTVQTATGKAGAQPQAELALKGNIEGQPLMLHFVGGSALMLRETDQPYPVDLQVDYGATRLTVKGTLQDPFQFSGANVQLALAGPDLADIYPLLGIPGPPTPPYRIAGHLSYQPGVWHVTNMIWHAGDSDLTGDVAIDERTKPERLTANLVSQRLAFADLAPLVGDTPGKRGNVSGQQARTEQQLEATGNLFPNVPLQVERLRAMNMDVTLDAKRLVAPAYLPVQSLDAHVRVENGEAVVQPLQMGFGGGKVVGEMSVDARENVPVARVSLAYNGVALADFFRDTRYFSTTNGRLEGRLSLAGVGRSLAQVMASANGDFVMAMEGGSISGLMVDLAGLQVGDALVLFITGDDRIPINCAMGRLVFRQGEVVFDRTLMDTEKSVLHFDGQASLVTQALSAKVTADVKHFNLLDLHGPVDVRGKLRSPAISIARVVPIPTPDLPTAKPTNCPLLARELLAERP
jgi:AsmA family protein